MLITRVIGNLMKTFPGKNKKWHFQEPKFKKFLPEYVPVPSVL